MTQTIYLDTAATAPLLEAVKVEMQRVLTLELGNAAALHGPGQRAKQIIEAARAKIAQLINAEPEEIIFTSGGTEANNTVMHIFEGQKIAVSSVEHPSVRAAARAYAKKMQEIPVDEWGRVELDRLRKIIQDQPKLVSVMLANNELGTIEPVKEIVKICKVETERRGQKIYVHTDASQAFGKIHIDVQELGVDYMTLSAHKCGGPLGIGTLYVRKGAPYKPLIYGGHQENGRRAGTSNVVGAIGFGAAAKWCWDNWSCKLYEEKVRPLRDELKKRILSEVPYSSCNSPDEACLPNILNISFQAAEGESVQLYLDLEGIVVSTGSACAAGDTKPSHVLMATHGDAEVAHSSVRFSLGLETTQSDIDVVMTKLPGIVQKLQGISTVKAGQDERSR